MADRRTKTLHQSQPEEAREPYLREVDPSGAEDVDVYSGIGADIRAARVRAGLDLDEVAAHLHIRQQHLEAIENGLFEEIPGRIYVLGFLRSYAEFLGLDGEEAARRFKAETGLVAAPSKLVFPTPAPESRMPKGWLLVGVLAIAGTIYGGWYHSQDVKRLTSELVAEVPARLLGDSPEEATPSRPEGAGTAGDAQDAADAQAPTAFTASAATEGQDRETAALAPTIAAAGPGGGPEGSTDAAAGTAAPTGSTTTGASTTPAGPEKIAAGTAETAPPAPAERPQPAPPPGPIASPYLAPPSETLADQPPSPATTDRPTRIAAAVPPPAAVPKAAVGTPAPGRGESVLPPSPPVRTAARAPSPPPPALPDRAGDDDYVPQVYGIANTDARVIVRARMDSWVQIRGADNELLLTRILHAGDIYMAPNRGDLVLMTGNAGALEILVDGRTAPPIGPIGTIRRQVSLDAAALLAGTAVRDN